MQIDMLTDAIGKHFGPNNNIPRSVLEVGDVDFSDDGLMRLMVRPRPMHVHMHARARQGP